MSSPIATTSTSRPSSHPAWAADWGLSGDKQKVTFLESGSTYRTSINSDADHGALVELGLDYTTYNFTDTSIGVYARTGVVLWRHRSNIERLIAGTEPKIGQKAKG